MDHAQCTEFSLRSSGTPGKRAVALDFQNRIILVAGRADYCGINKRVMFTVMNYLLPEVGHMSMNCSFNVGAHGDTALLFGPSGTGKTTLSADPDRQLIGDDEHAGHYAKLINFNKRAEPVIAAALSMRGVLIENVAALPDKPIEETDFQDLDLDDNSITENTRISYLLHANPHVLDGEVGPHPNTIVLLRRCLWRSPTNQRPVIKGGDVSLCFGLHLEACGHRGWDH